MINRTSIAAVVLGLGVALAACGADGGMGMAVRAEDAEGESGGSGGSGDGSGGAGPTAPDAGSGGAGGTVAATGGAPAGGAGGSAGVGGGAGGAQASGGAPGSGGAGGTAPQPDVLFCGQAVKASTASCGYLVTLGHWEYLWKGDMACATCTMDNKQVNGCKVKKEPNTTSNPVPDPTSVLCVPDCRAECCSKRMGSTCQSDANCCSPLRCMDNGPGKNKTCK